MTHDTTRDDPTRGTTGPSSLSRRELLTRAAIGAAAVAARAVPSVRPAGAAVPTIPAAGKTLTIGAKGFAENEIVAHRYLLLLQQAGLPVHGTITQDATRRGSQSPFTQTGRKAGQPRSSLRSHSLISNPSEVAGTHTRE